MTLVTGEYPPARGGIGDYTAILAAALTAAGARTTVIVASDQAVQSGPEIPVLQTGRFGWKASRRLGRTLARVRPDIVHVQFQAGAFGMHPAAYLLELWPARPPGARLVVTFHDLKEPYLFPKAGPLRQLATQRLARSADAIIVTNPEDWHTAIRRLGVSAPAAIPIGSNIPPVTDSDRERWRQRHGLQDSLVIVHFGFLAASKGVGDMLAAIARTRVTLSERGGPIPRLVMVGGAVGGTDPTSERSAEEARRLAHASGIGELVHWTGFLNPAEVSGWLAAADLGVLPFREGASFRHGSLAALLAHGVPLITTRPPAAAVVPGLPRLVDGENARLVPPGDVEALTAAIVTLGQDPALRGRLGRGARDTARQMTWSTIAERTLALYRGLPRR